MLRQAITALIFVVIGASAFALEVKPYDATTLAAAQTAGKAVAVHFHADWCPTCANQAKSLEALKADATLKEVTVLVANYDTEKDLKRAMKVRSQSTLVVFKGATEVARDGGNTEAAKLKAVLAKAL